MTHLRPIERRVLAMREEGQTDEEIAGRLKRSADHVARIAAYAEIPRNGHGSREDDELLRPVERRVLALREAGQSHAEIGEKFRRSADFARRVEGFARYRQALALLP
ncbi:MAG: hypothetical protein GEU79_00750 [Acidimicrobiia bacterium]|nr:hypothetical protein [Acidimicrobiia bacterium]